MNQVQFKWCKYCDWNSQTTGKEVGKTSLGEWGDWKMCPDNYYMTNIIMKAQDKQGKNDDTAVNDIAFICRPMITNFSYNNYELVTLGNGMGYGSWKRLSPIV